MSAKWRALQHRHRYTYSSVVFPQSFVESLADLSPSHPRFCAELLELTSLNSTYSQVNHVKRVASSFGDVLSSIPNEQSLSKAARLYLEIMFLENSTPLHRTLVSALAKARNHQGLICGCFRALCEEYGGSRGKGKRFCVSRAVLSIMGMPKLGYLMGVVEDCAVVVARDIVYGLSSVVLEASGWARPSPIVMEQCQEALSCLYYLLQKFPAKINDLGDKVVMEMIIHVLLSILKLSTLSRDCFVAAGVSFCAALQVCLSAEELGLFIIEGIFQAGPCCSGTVCESDISEIILKIPYRGNLYHEICSFPALSRLCLIRGILTAVSRNLLNMHFVVARDKFNRCEGLESANKVVKTILYDGILPELCNVCENPTDSHFNFHALTVMQICLQQIKTSLLAKLAIFSEDYDPLKEEMGTRILRIIWKNLEDPLSQTVKQVHLIFDLLLDVQSTLHWGDSSDKIKLFLRKIALDLLHLGPRCKGRYVPLASLTKRLGARALLGMNPGLLSEMVQAYIDDDVCCAVTSFLKCFLENLRDDCWKTDGVERGYVLYREHCLHPFLYGLASGASKLRSNLNTYALPVLVEVDLDSIFPMLALISVTPTEEDNDFLHFRLNGTRVDLSIEQKVAVAISLLKVSRLLALIEGDIDWLEETLLDQTADGLEAEYVSNYALVCVKGIKMKILVEWLVQALTHVDDSLRVDAAEFLFLNPRTASLPSHLELALMKEAIPLNMRCSSTAFQMKWCSLFRKFFARVRTALERQLKQQAWRPHLHHKGTEICLAIRSEDTSFSRADDLFCFMRWLSAFLFFSCYPSAPYKRKIMAMELIVIMMDVWAVAPSSEENQFFSTESLHPYSRGVTSPDLTFLLVGSIVDSWDRLRENSFRILVNFPTPLPGLSSDEMVVNIIEWAKKLVCSPRVRESDAGALTLRLIFRKYVLERKWIVRVSVNVTCDSHSQPSESMHPVMDYVWSLINWLDVAVEEGRRDLSEACKNSFVHGVLLSLRYTFEEMDWNSDAVVSSMSEMRRALNKLMDLVLEITSLALCVVSADAWYLPEDMGEVADDDNFVLDFPEETNDAAPPSELDKCSKVGLEQVVMVGCWLAMKEVSLLLGTIIRKIPLPASTYSDSLGPNDADISAVKIPEAVLDLKQLEAMGNHFLEVLLKMKHNGAIDKTRAGFTALCNRLLCSNDPELCRLTESWMELLMERTVAKGQVVDDLLRRSAGIPAAFIALFLSEPEGAPKKLLPCALRWLIDVANQSLQDLNASNVAIGDPCIFLRENLDRKDESALPVDSNVNERTSKIRDEGVIPTVHAFNVLRTVFNDTNLATDTSGFSAESLIVSIRAFSSPYWEVRNSACLAYTALVRRMIGFLNVHKRESARRSLTGLEFFHRYPSLHFFLLEELKVATELLDDRTTRHSESSLAKVVHPSLCPVLILLSRLKPSAIASEIGDDLDPFLFMPFIRRCSTQRNMRIRVLASRALTGLVSNEKLPGVIVNIATELSCLGKHCFGISIPHIFSTANEAQHTPFNLIHGMLLQLCSLLDTNCRNLVDFSKKDQILSDLIQLLAKCSWIGSPRLCPCPPVNTTFLRVLDHMLSIARGCQSGELIFDIRNLLLELTAECLDLDGSCVLPYYDPAVPELLEQSATSYFSCFFQVSNEKTGENIHLSQKNGPSDINLLAPETLGASCQLQVKVACCLSDSLYEVRLATLKWLLKFLRIMESGFHGQYFSSSEMAAVRQWTNVNLQDTIMKLLPLEKYHKCTHYILRVFFTWNLQQYNQVGSETDVGTKFVGVMDCDSVLQIWGRLLSLYNIVRHAKTRGTLMCCMAVCIKRLAGLLASSIFGDIEKTMSECLVQLESWNQLYGCFSRFNKLIELHSASSEPVNMRKAAAESIIASGMLEQAGVIGPLFHNNMLAETGSSFSDKKEIAIMYAHQVLKMWFTCVRLLEDEDDELRQKLALNVQRCFVARESLGISNAFSVPTQVEKVLKLSFEHLSSIFGHWAEYFNYLAQWVHDVGKYEKSGGNLVRRVFDKEIDNHHEEKLLICQICCLHMEKLFVSSSRAVNSEEDSIKNNLYTWRTRFFTQLVIFGEDHMAKDDDVFWIGGIGNHKDAFLPLYANLLGFYALSKCLLSKDGITSDRELVLDVVKLAKALTLFLRNPLILNLFCLVVELHERKLNLSADISMLKYRTDDVLWDCFDPYFLLK